MAPKQPKSGLADLSSKFVLVVGSKGFSKNFPKGSQKDFQTKRKRLIKELISIYYVLQLYSKIMMKGSKIKSDFRIAIHEKLQLVMIIKMLRLCLC